MPVKKSEGFVLLFFCILLGIGFTFVLLRGDISAAGFPVWYITLFAILGLLAFVLGVVRGIYMIRDYRNTGLRIECLEGDASVEISQQLGFGRYFRITFLTLRGASLFLGIVAGAMALMFLSRGFTDFSNKILWAVILIVVIVSAYSFIKLYNNFRDHYPLTAVVYAGGIFINGRIKVPWKMVYKTYSRGRYLVLDLHSPFKIVLENRQYEVCGGETRALNEIIEHYMNNLKI